MKGSIRLENYRDFHGKLVSSENRKTLGPNFSPHSLSARTLGKKLGVFLRGERHLIVGLKGGLFLREEFYGKHISHK